MEILLNKDYKVVSDERNYALYRKAEKQPEHLKKNKDSDEEPGWVIIGYYQDMDYLYSELVERHIRITDAKTFQEVLEAVKELKKSLVASNPA